MIEQIPIIQQLIRDYMLIVIYVEYFNTQFKPMQPKILLSPCYFSN